MTERRLSPSSAYMCIEALLRFFGMSYLFCASKSYSVNGDFIRIEHGGNSQQIHRKASQNIYEGNEKLADFCVNHAEDIMGCIEAETKIRTLLLEFDGKSGNNEKQERAN